MKPSVMDQHRISRTYLEGFTDPDAPPGRKSSCWIRKRSGGAGWYERPPRRITIETDCYTLVDKAGKRDLVLENVLRNIETRVGRLLKERISQPRQLRPRDREALSLFAATMRGRTKPAQAMIEKFWSDVSTMTLRHRYERARKSAESLESVKRELRHISGESPVIDKLTAEDLNPENYKIGFENPAWFAAASVAASARTGEIIDSMGWSFVVSEGTNYFITSDNPCVVCNPSGPPLYRHGLVYEDSFVLLPLRRDVALLAGWKTPPGERWVKVTPDRVRNLNLWTASYASELLIAPKPRFPGVDELPWDRKEPPDKVSG